MQQSVRHQKDFCASESNIWQHSPPTFDNAKAGLTLRSLRPRYGLSLVQCNWRLKKAIKNLPKLVTGILNILKPRHGLIGPWKTTYMRKTNKWCIKYSFQLSRMIWQVVAYQRLKTIEKFKISAQKLVAYRRWLPTRRCHYMISLRKFLVFWKNGHWWKVVAYKSWLHREVGLYIV